MFDVFINDASVGCSDYVDSFETLEEAKNYICNFVTQFKSLYFVVDADTDKEVWYYGQDEESNMQTVDEFNENCWTNGTYNDNCFCEVCEHRYECSGSDADDDE